MPQYTSKYPGLQLIARKEVIQRYPDGTSEMLKPPLVVEFGQYGASHPLMEGEGENAVPVRATGEGLPGSVYETFEFQGGFIDTDTMIPQKRDEGLWDEDDAQTVLRVLEEAVTNPNSPRYGFVQRYEMPATQAPWPTYDSMDAELIAEFALNAGLIVPAIFYEKATKARPEVMADLTAAAERQNELATLEAPAVA